MGEMVAEEIEVGELHIFTGQDFAITVRHGRSPDFGLARKRLENDPATFAFGPEGVVQAILDAVVDGYAPVLGTLENDIFELPADARTRVGTRLSDGVRPDVAVCLVLWLFFRRKGWL